LILPETEAHHAAHVLRLKPGDAIELFDGSGGSASASVAAVKHGAVAVEIRQVYRRAERPAPVIRLAFAVPKGNRLDWLLEKAAELGVAALAPIRFERSVAGTGELSSAKRRRWLGHCIAAAKQAGLDFLPAIEDLRTLDEFLAAAERPGIYGDLSDHARPIAEVLEGHAPPVIVIGPEGGLTDAERRALDAAAFIPVRLGPTTLHIETAALALTAAVIART
jgi:16S rRNA (uracil1498-N3)-methyltransferase